MPKILSSGGVHSVETAKSFGVEIARNDRKRYDGYLGCVSLSIGHPNSKLFYRWRQETPEPWVVLLIDPGLLARRGTLFSPLNAAAGRGDDCRPGLRGLQRLFGGVFEGEFEWERLSSAPPNVPTSVQAEVLVWGSVPVSAIRAVCLENRSDVTAELRDVCGQVGIPLATRPDLFKERAAVAQPVFDDDEEDVPF